MLIIGIVSNLRIVPLHDSICENEHLFWAFKAFEKGEGEEDSVTFLASTFL
jgi:hypothetical protein